MFRCHYPFSLNNKNTVSFNPVVVAVANQFEADRCDVTLKLGHNMLVQH